MVIISVLIFYWFNFFICDLVANWNKIGLLPDSIELYLPSQLDIYGSAFDSLCLGFVNQSNGWTCLPRTLDFFSDYYSPITNLIYFFIVYSLVISPFCHVVPSRLVFFLSIFAFLFHFLFFLDSDLIYYFLRLYLFLCFQYLFFLSIPFLYDGDLTFFFSESLSGFPLNTSRLGPFGGLLDRSAFRFQTTFSNGNIIIIFILYCNFILLTLVICFYLIT